MKITKAGHTVERDYNGVALIIGRTNSTEFKSKVQLATKRLNRNNDFNQLTVEQQDSVLAEAAAGTVLQGWSGFILDGKEVPFTLANAKELLTDDPDCREFVMSVGGTLAEFQQVENEESLKKPFVPSSGV